MLQRKPRLQKKNKLYENRKQYMKNMFLRDIQTAWTTGSSAGIGLLFFLSSALLIPFALGADKIALKSAAGLLWLFALLAVLLGLDRLFCPDKEDGSLDILLCSADFPALTFAIIGKIAAHWVTSALPLVLAAPVFSLLLNPDIYYAAAICFALAIGTPAILCIGACGAALTCALPRGGVLLTVLILPLVIPVIIFGIAATHALAAGGALQPLYFLAALTLFFAFICPIAAALTLKWTAE